MRGSEGRREVGSGGRKERRKNEEKNEHREGEGCEGETVGFLIPYQSLGRAM